MINHLNCLCNILFADEGRGVDTGFKFPLTCLILQLVGDLLDFGKPTVIKPPTMGEIALIPRFSMCLLDGK